MGLGRFFKLKKRYIQLGRLKEVKNTYPMPNAAPYYYAVRVKLPSGERRTLMLTQNDLDKALYRARMNIEDLPEEFYTKEERKKLEEFAPKKN